MNETMICFVLQRNQDTAPIHPKAPGCAVAHVMWMSSAEGGQNVAEIGAERSFAPPPNLNVRPYPKSIPLVHNLPKEEFQQGSQSSAWRQDNQLL